MPYIGGPFAVQSGQTLTLRPPENPGLLPYVVVMNEAPRVPTLPPAPAISSRVAPS